jgi:hypothetical protein
MTHFADSHINKQKIDRAESVVLHSLIGGGLALCLLGAAAYDIGQVFPCGRDVASRRPGPRGERHNMSSRHVIFILAQCSQLALAC